jgi:hypothetical protein
MDINKIFDVFKPEDEVNETTQVVFEGPIMWIGMFSKLIANYEVFTKQIIMFFRTTNQDLNMDDIEQASSYMVYTRAYDSLSKIDPENPLHIEALKLYSDKPFKTALKNALEYYENIEEYEKCAFLKKIQDVITFS